MLNANHRALSREVTLKQGPKGCIKLWAGQVYLWEDQLSHRGPILLHSSSPNPPRFFQVDNRGAWLHSVTQEPRLWGLCRLPHAASKVASETGDEHKGMVWGQVLWARPRSSYSTSAWTQSHWTCKGAGKCTATGCTRAEGENRFGWRASILCPLQGVRLGHRVSVVGNEQRHAGKRLTTSSLEGRTCVSPDW